MYLLELVIDWGSGIGGWLKGAAVWCLILWVGYKLITARHEKPQPIDPPQRTVDPDEDKELGYYDEHNY